MEPSVNKRNHSLSENQPTGWSSWFVAGLLHTRLWVRPRPSGRGSRVVKCPFGFGALGEIKFLSSVSHRQSSDASLWGGNWVSKLLAAIGIVYMVPK
ncbi:hypothetical protein TNCV_371331 [Trichonephila clavipes]|nr:hypothetical protein TNCV_371331 [Trichonephila clavipes]